MHENVRRINFAENAGKLHNAMFIGNVPKMIDFTKAEIEDILKNTDDTVLVFDKYDDFTELAEKYNGQIIKAGKDHFNICDMNMGWDNPMNVSLAEKADDLMVFAEDFIGKEFNPYQKAAFLNAIKTMYEPYIQKMTEKRKQGLDSDIDVSICPTAYDIYNTLIDSNTPEGNQVALMLEPYLLTGMYSYSYKTDIQINPNARIIIYDASIFSNELYFIFFARLLEIAHHRDNKASMLWIYGMFDSITTEKKKELLEVLCKRARLAGCIITIMLNNTSFFTDSGAAVRILNNLGYVGTFNASVPDHELLQRIIPDITSDGIYNIGRGREYSFSKENSEVKINNNLSVDTLKTAMLALIDGYPDIPERAKNRLKIKVVSGIEAIKSME